MPFREKVKKALNRRLSSRIDPPMAQTAQTCHAEARHSGAKDIFYQPGEEPPPKYPCRYNKAHQDLLKAYDFGSAQDRTRSIASGSSYNDLKRSGERKSSLTPSEIRRKIQQSLFMASDPPDHPDHLLRATDHPSKRRPSRLDSITEANRETSPDSYPRMDSLSLVDEGSAERDDSATTTEPDYPITPLDSIVGTSFSLPIQTTTELPLPPMPTRRLLRKSRYSSQFEPEY